MISHSPSLWAIHLVAQGFTLLTLEREFQSIELSMEGEGWIDVEPFCCPADHPQGVNEDDIDALCAIRNDLSWLYAGRLALNIIVGETQGEAIDISRMIFDRIELINKPEILRAVNSDARTLAYRIVKKEKQHIIELAGELLEHNHLSAEPFKCIQMPRRKYFAGKRKRK